mgnify:CR=1 FL=1
MYDNRWIITFFLNFIILIEAANEFFFISGRKLINSDRDILYRCTELCKSETRYIKELERFI